MGTDKALLQFDGIALLEKSIALCKEVSDKVLISSNNVEHHKFIYPVIADEIENCGPMGGISSCLKKSETAWNFVISVDAAFVELPFISFLLSEIGNFDAIVPFSVKGNEPLIALYNKSCLPMIEQKLQNRDFKMQNLLQAINTKFVDGQKWIEEYPKLFHNLNRPEDLQAFKSSK